MVDLDEVVRCEGVGGIDEHVEPEVEQFGDEKVGIGEGLWMGCCHGGVKSGQITGMKW